MWSEIERDPHGFLLIVWEMTGSYREKEEGHCLVCGPLWFSRYEKIALRAPRDQADNKG